MARIRIVLKIVHDFFVFFFVVFIIMTLKGADIIFELLTVHVHEIPLALVRLRDISFREAARH